LLLVVDRSGHSFYDDNQVQECARRAPRRENSRPGALCSPRLPRGGQRRMRILCAGYRPRSLRTATQAAVGNHQEPPRLKPTSPNVHSSHQLPHGADSCGEPIAVWNGSYALDHAIARATRIEDICRAETAPKTAGQQDSCAATKLRDGIEPASSLASPQSRPAFGAMNPALATALDPSPSRLHHGAYCLTSNCYRNGFIASRESVTETASLPHGRMLPERFRTQIIGSSFRFGIRFLAADLAAH
jgi:hypothetical protein